MSWCSRNNRRELCTALEDNSPEHDWWLDPRTGELEPWSQLGDNEQETHPEERGLVAVEPVDSRESYADMEDFAGRSFHTARPGR